MPHIEGQPAHNNMVDVQEVRSSSPHIGDLGPCPVWSSVCGLMQRTAIFRVSPDWEDPGMAVLAYLTGAGLKPSIYLGERY